MLKKLSVMMKQMMIETLMLSQLHLATKGYAISVYRDILNSKLEGYAISNCKVKQLLIKVAGEDRSATNRK